MAAAPTAWTWQEATDPIWNVNDDADRIRKAIKGLGTDDKTLVEIISHRSHAHFKQVRAVYKQKFSLDLIEDIKGDTSGQYQDILVALVEDRDEYFAKLVHKAVDGLGTNDSLLLEVLLTRNNAELKAMQEAYQRLYHKSMVSDVSGDTSGDYKDLLVAVLRAERIETGAVDPVAAVADADLLYQKGEGKIGTDEKAFINILTARSREHIQAIATAYAQKTGHSLEKAIDSETSGNFKKGLTILVNPLDKFFAEQLHDAVDGVGTKDDKLIRIMAYLTRDQLRLVAAAYAKIYKKPLANDLGGDTSGNYKKVILALLPSIV